MRTEEDMNVLFYTKLNDIWKKELSELKDRFPDVNFIIETNPDTKTLTMTQKEVYSHHYFSSEIFSHLLQTGKRNKYKVPVFIKSSYHGNSMEMGIPAEHITESL